MNIFTAQGTPETRECDPNRQRRSSCREPREPLEHMIVLMFCMTWTLMIYDAGVVSGNVFKSGCCSRPRTSYEYCCTARLLRHI